MITNLTTKQIESIQIDEGVIFLNYGETDERLLAPTRGGGEFAATVTVRDIEFDGRHGKTTGTQVIEENLALAIPTCTIAADDGKTIKNPTTGVIGADKYLKNVTMFAKTIGGKYKKIAIYNAMHETGFNVKAVQKAEGELALEFLAHYKHSDLDGDLWAVTEITQAPDMSEKTTQTQAADGTGKAVSK